MMGTEQFSLRWNNHTNHLVDVFGNLLQSESLVDVTLSCEGQSLKAHKLVLSACSPYFKALFQDHTDNHPIVILKDVKFAELRSIIEFMYRGEVEVEKNDLDSLFLTAEGLMIKGLAGSRPPFSGPPRVPPTHPDDVTDRKRPLPEAFDTGGEGGERRTPPAEAAPAPQPPAACSNGGDSVLLKRPKLEPLSGDENSADGMEPGAAGTTYLCPECGRSFRSQQQLLEHNLAAHGVAGAERASVVRGPPRQRSDDPPSAAPAAAAAAAAAAKHSHSWPPHDVWGQGEGRLRLPYRSDLPLGLMVPLLPPMPETALNLAAGEAAGSPAPPSPPAGSPPGSPSDAAQPVTCKVCSRAFESPVALREHAAVHQGERPFRCDWCGKAFKFRHHLKDHCRIHTGERPFDCKTCGKSFARSSILKTHSKIHRTEERRLELAAPFLGGGAPQGAEEGAGAPPAAEEGAQ